MARKISKALIVFAIAGLACQAFLSGQEDPTQTGPVSLIIQYRVAPAQRALFRDRLLKEGLENFERLKRDSLLSAYHVLFSRYVDTDSWDALALLTFPNYQAAAHWRQVERRTPAGLPQGLLELTQTIGTYPADLVRDGNGSNAAPHPVFLVVPYLSSVPTPQYLKYADDYVRPQFEGWIKEGILHSYQMYLQRYTASRPWDVLIFLEYKDDESFGQRERVVAKVRTELQTNPVWKAVSDNKKNVRIEKEAVIADELVLER